MPRPTNFFTQLAGVPVHYDRFQDPRFSYGTRGKPLRFHATEAFERKLDICFEELWQVCPLASAEVITSAGAFVDKPGAHGQGSGFDIDGIFWADKTFITLHYPQDRRFYLGVEALLRKHFGTVLNYEYNQAHRDHFHVDDLQPIGFFAHHRSRVLFLQMALTYLFGRPVEVDGLIGPETNGAARDLLVGLGLSNAGDIANDTALHAKLNEVWLTLLDRAAESGFAGVGASIGAEKSPLELIEDLYSVIEQELGDSAARKQIETTLTAFVNHERTAAWLVQPGGNNIPIRGPFSASTAWPK